MTVVGVVENVRLDGLVDGPGFRTVGAYYIPARSIARPHADPRGANGAGTGQRHQRDSRASWRRSIRSCRSTACRRWKSASSVSLVDRRTPMILASSFAVVALFLAAIGIYGVLAYQVSQRTREIGIRMALGAATSSIFGMVLREGAAIVVIGVALGLSGAFLLRQTLQSQLYEIGAMDPLVIASVGCNPAARRPHRVPVAGTQGRPHGSGRGADAMTRPRNRPRTQSQPRDQATGIRP